MAKKRSNFTKTAMKTKAINIKRPIGVRGGIRF